MSNTKEVFLEKADIIKILQSYLKSNDFTYVEHHFESLADHVEGYLSEHYSLQVKYYDGKEEIEQRFFIKTNLKESGFLSLMAHDLDVFGRETFLYTNLFKQFQQLPNYKEILPNCYLANENLLVLEDISVDGFQTSGRLKLFDFEQCKIVLETLAQFHAYSFALEELKTKDGIAYRLNEVFPVQFEDKFFGDTPSAVKEFHQASINCLLDLIREMDSSDKKFIELLNELSDNELTDLKYDLKYRSICLHGDLWSNNIMFKSNAECKFVDFQMLRYYLPAFDVQLFLYGNTSTEFRSVHEMELLKIYFDSLNRNLKENGIEKSILTFEDLLNTCILKGPEAKIQAISDMALLYLPKVFLEEQLNNCEDIFKTILVDDRSKYVIDIFRKDLNFRERMIGELLDLKQLIEKRKELLKNLH